MSVLLKSGSHSLGSTTTVVRPHICTQYPHSSVCRPATAQTLPCRCCPWELRRDLFVLLRILCYFVRTRAAVSACRFMVNVSSITFSAMFAGFRKICSTKKMCSVQPASRHGCSVFVCFRVQSVHAERNQTNCQPARFSGPLNYRPLAFLAGLPQQRFALAAARTRR